MRSEFRGLVFLTQTDTTMGFVSQNSKRIDSIKQRPTNKRYITALTSFTELKQRTRVPKIHKNRVRRADLSTFVFQNMHSYRVVKESMHLLLLSRFGWAYTTSANPNNKPYDKEFAYKEADVIVSSPKTDQHKPSQIYKLGKTKLSRLR